MGVFEDLGGVKKKTDAAWVPVQASATIPVELGLQSDQTTFMGLKTIKE